MSDLLNENRISEFKDKMLTKHKNGMLRKFFHQGQQEFIEVPIFTESTGQRQITPFRNIQCLKYTCLYDIQELIDRFQKANYSSYLNFICNNCRKLIDIYNFWRDDDLEKIIKLIWEKYNLHSIQCSKAALFNDGTWEPVLPEYVKRMFKKIFKQKRNQIFDDSVPEHPNSITQYEIILIEEFTQEEFAQLWKEQIEDLEEPVNENEIMLRRYDINMKWGEFMHVKSQTSFMLYPMRIYMRYLDQYLSIKLQRQGITRKRTAFITLKVHEFERFRRKAQFYFISDNLDGPKASQEDFEIVMIMMWYDERWIGMICSLTEQKMHQIDYIDPDISRSSQDEIYDLACVIIEQMFAPYKFPQIKSTEQLRQDILEQQRVLRRVTYYSDCGHHVALYFLAYIQEELELIELQRDWPEETSMASRLHYVKVKQGDSQVFTSKICWLFLKMAEDEGVQIKVYDFQNKLAPIMDDSLDTYLNETQIQQQKPKKIMISKGLNQFAEHSSNMTSEINQTKLQKLWGLDPNDVSQQYNNPDNSQLTNKSFKPVLQSTQLPVKYNGGNQRYNNSQPRKSINKVDDSRDSVFKDLASQLGHNKRNNVQSQEKPFLVMPKQELDRYMKAYKEQIKKEYREQAIIRGYFNQQLIQKYQDQLQATNQDKSRFGVQQDSDRFQMNKEEIEKLRLNLDRSLQEDMEIKKLQNELGINSFELNSLDPNQLVLQDSWRGKR